MWTTSSGGYMGEGGKYFPFVNIFQREKNYDKILLSYIIQSLYINPSLYFVPRGGGGDFFCQKEINMYKRNPTASTHS